MLTRAGAESSVSCKTYVTTLVALEWLGAALWDGWRVIESTLQEAAPAAERIWPVGKAKVRALVDLLSGIRSLFVDGARHLHGGSGLRRA